MSTIFVDEGRIYIDKTKMENIAIPIEKINPLPIGLPITVINISQKDEGHPDNDWYKAHLKQGNITSVEPNDKYKIAVYETDGVLHNSLYLFEPSDFRYNPNLVTIEYDAANKAISFKKKEQMGAPATIAEVEDVSGAGEQQDKKEEKHEVDVNPGQGLGAPESQEDKKPIDPATLATAAYWAAQGSKKAKEIVKNNTTGGRKTNRKRSNRKRTHRKRSNRNKTSKRR